MTPERYRRVKRAFLRACGLPPTRQVRYLERLALRDAGLVAAVRRMLAADAEQDSAGDPSRLQAWLGLADELALAGDVADLLPERIGQYRLIRKLGEGGMALVFEAEQEPVHRRVALKIIRCGLPSPTARQRFKHEVELLGRLHHSCIAHLYEAGTTEVGRAQLPFFAMEFVEGTPITEYVVRQQSPLAARVRLMARVCDAVQHAHDQGILHRDLKPANVLVDAAGQPKVLDFGIAREIDAGLRATDMTGEGQLLGTLAYMSPEQIAGPPQALDGRSDVYSLGVILYELLTGRRPVEVADCPLPEALRLICEHEPLPPALVDPRLRGDLDTIVRKALERDSQRRYVSAAALREDLERHLAQLPIRARPPSQMYLLSRLVARHKGPALLLLALVLVLATSSIAMTWLYRRAARDARAAQQASQFLQQMLASINPEQSGHTVPVRDLLDHAAARAEDELQAHSVMLADMRQTLGQAYRRLGLYDAAEQQLRQSLALRERLAPGDSSAAATLKDLGDVLIENGAYVEAEAVLSDALERRLRAPVDPATRADTVASLARVCNARGDFPRAVALSEQVLALRTAHWGDHHTSVADALNGLAVCLLNQGEYPRAEALLRRSLALRRSLLGEEHPDVVRNKNSLAAVLYARGDYAEAETLYQQGLAAWQRTRGVEHPYVATIMSNLALLLTARGDLEEAERLHRQALETRRKLLHAGHPDIASSLVNLATILQARRDPAHAAPLAEEGLALFRAALGDDHPEVGSALALLARIHQAEGEMDQAEAEARTALRILETRLPTVHPDLADALSALGGILIDRQACTEAEPVLRRCLAIRRDKLAAGSVLVTLSELQLAECLAHLGRRVEASALLAGAQSAQGQVEPQREPELRAAMGRVEALLDESLAPVPSDTPIGDRRD